MYGVNKCEEECYGFKEVIEESTEIGEEDGDDGIDCKSDPHLVGEG